jgi:hypothetical protein
VSWLQAIRLPDPPEFVDESAFRTVRIPLNRPGRGGRKIAWNGTVYSSIRECAKAIGISQWALRRKLGLKHDPRKRHDR